MNSDRRRENFDGGECNLALQQGAQLKSQKQMLSMKVIVAGFATDAYVAEVEIDSLVQGKARFTERHGDIQLLTEAVREHAAIIVQVKGRNGEGQCRRSRDKQKADSDEEWMASKHRSRYLEM